MNAHYYFIMKVGPLDAEEFELNEGVTVLVFNTQVERDSAARVLKIPDIRKAVDSSFSVGELDAQDACQAFFDIINFKAAELEDEEVDDDEDDDEDFGGGVDGDDDGDGPDFTPGDFDIDTDDNEEEWDEEDEGHKDGNKVAVKKRTGGPSASNLTSDNAERYVRNIFRSAKTKKPQ